MARQKTKTCLSCQRVFRGRADAKTCSERCRKRLNRAKQTVEKEAAAVKRATESVIHSIEREIEPATATEGGFVEVPVKVNNTQARSFTPPAPESLDIPQTAQSVPSPQLTVATTPTVPTTGSSVVVPVSTPQIPGQVINPVSTTIPRPAATSQSPQANPLPTNSVPQPNFSASQHLVPSIEEGPLSTSVVEASKPQSPRWRFHFSFPRSARLALAATFVITVVAIGTYLLGNQQAQNPNQAASTGTISNLSTNSSTLSNPNTESLHLNKATIIDNGASFTATGPVVIQNEANSQNAFRVQNAAGDNLIVADTLNGKVGIGTSPSANGATLQVSGGISADNGATTISNNGLVINNTLICTAQGCSTLAAQAATGKVFSGDASTLQGHPASYFLNTSNLASALPSNVAYTNASQTFSGINSFTAAGNTFVGDGSGLSSINGSSIASGTVADARLSSNVALKNADNTFTGNNTFNGVTIQNGNFLFQSATNSTGAFQIQNAAGNDNLLIGDTINTRIGIGVQPQYTLDVNGDINIASSQALRIGGVAVCTSAGCTATSGSGNPIQNGTTTQTNANFNIQSAGSSDVGGVIKGASGQTADLFEGQNSAGTIVYALDPQGNVNITGNYEINGATLCGAGGCTAASGSGNYVQNGIALQTGANFNIESAATGDVGGIIRGISGQTADLLQLKDGSGNVVTSIGANGAVLAKDTSTGSASFFQIQNSSGTSLLTANTTTGQILLPNATLSSTALLLGGDANLYRSAASTLKTDGNLITAGNLTSNGSVLAQNTANSTTAFQVQNAAGSALLTADTSNFQVTTTKLQASSTIASASGTADAQLSWNYIASTGLTMSGNEITDATRQADIQGDGITPPDSSTGIWESTTNLVTNGGFESNTTGWTEYNSSGAFTRTTSTSKFGSASVAVSCNNGSLCVYGTDITTSSGVSYTASAWLKIASQSGNREIRLEAAQPAGGSTVATSGNYTTTSGGWMRIQFTFSSTNTSTRLQITSDGSSGSLTAYIDGIQLEQKAYATPYVETNGSTATRNQSVVTAPFSLINATQGWAAFRVRMGFASASIAHGHDFMQWYYDSNNNFNFALGTSPNLTVTLDSAGVNESASLNVGSWNAGDVITAIVFWTPTQLGLSWNGGAFTTASSTHSPALTPSVFNLGSDGAGSGVVLDGSILWTATGTGTLSNADAAALNNYGNTDPLLSNLTTLNSGAATPTMVWNGVNANYSTNSGVAQSQITLDDAGLYRSSPNTLQSNSNLVLQGTSVGLASQVSLSGNEITDNIAGTITRTNATQGDGRTPPDSSVGIWEGTTNLVTNGGFETNTNGWTAQTNVTANRDTSTAKFGSSSANISTSSTTGQNVYSFGVTGLTNGTTYTFSAWVKSSVSGNLQLQAGVGSGSLVASSTISSNSNWTRYSLTFTYVTGMGSTCGVGFWLDTTGVNFSVDGVQLEQKAYATPYVETNGSTASRNDARVQASANNLSASQGWVAARLRLGANLSSLTGNRYIFQTGTDSSDRIVGYINPSAKTLGIYSSGTGGNVHTEPYTMSGNVGDYVTAVFIWSSSNLAVSLNGSTFSSTPATSSNLPASLGSSFDIGSGGTIQSGAGIDSDILWTAAGTGTLSNADAANINSWGNTDPNMNSFGGVAAPSFVWQANNANYQSGSYNPITFQVQNSTGSQLFGVNASTGALQLPNATSSTAALIFGNDSSADLYRSGTATLATDGSLAVGSNLTVGGTYNGNTFNNNTLSFSGASIATVSAASAQSIALQSGDTSHFVILQPSGGNVGIGTTSPQAKLDVLEGGSPGIQLLSGNATSYAAIKLGRTTADASIGIAGVVGNFANGSLSGDLVLRTETTANQIILNNGTNGPGFVLYNNTIGIQVQPTSGLFQLASGTTSANGIYFGTDTNLYRTGTGALRTDGLLDANVSASSSFAFTTRIAGAPSNSFVIKGDGTQVWGTAQDTNLYRSAAGTLQTDGNLNVAGASGINLGTGVTGQIYQWNTSNGNLAINHGLVVDTGNDASTGLFFGSAADTNLYRSAASTLKTDGSLQAAVNVSAASLTATSTIGFSNTGDANQVITLNMVVTTSVTANYVVVIDTANAGQVTTTGASNYGKVFGVATQTQASGGVAQPIAVSGVYQVMADTGAVNVGDMLVTSGTTGMVMSSTSPNAGAVLGRAMSAKAAGSSGLVWVYLTPGQSGGGGSGSSGYGLMESDFVNTNATLPGALSDGQIATIGNTIYIFGGQNSGASNVIYSAPVSNPTSWTNTGSTLPVTLGHSALAIIGNTIYLFGGYNGSSCVNAIYTASTAAPTVWSTATGTLPAGLCDSSLAVIGSYVYLFGGTTNAGSSGSTNVIYKAPISDPVNSWTNTGKTLPSVLGYSSLEVIGNYVYLFGGSNGSASWTSSIYRAAISDPTTWSSTGGSLPASNMNTTNNETAIVGNYVYLLGGAPSNTATNAIYRAPINNPVNGWVSTGSTLPGALEQTHIAIVGSALYTFGGSNGSSTINSIYSAPIFNGSPNVSSNPSWKTAANTSSSSSSSSSSAITSSTPQFSLDTNNTLKTGLVSYWKLDESTPTTAVDSVGYSNGTSTGTTVVTGKINNARKFNGSTDLINVGNSSTINLTSTGSISAWVKSNNGATCTGGGSGGAAIYGSFTNGAVLYLARTSCTINLSKYGVNNVGSNLAITDTNWHHVVVTFNGSTASFYLDNVAASGNPYTYSNSFGTGISYAIGGTTDGSNTDAFNGTIDEVGLWSKALSSQEITDLYNLGNGDAYLAGNTVGFSGGIANNTVTQTANFNVQSVSGSAVTATIQGATNQSADILEVKDGSGNIGLATNALGNTNVHGGATYSQSSAFNGFSPHTEITASTTNPRGIAYGDFNGDGKKDMVVVNYGSSAISVLLGNGNGTFAAPASYATGNTPVYVTVADFNGDGCPDIATANYGANNVSVFLNKCDGSGTFNAAVNYATAVGPVGITAGDFNGDGKLDIVTANSGAGNISVLLNSGSGTFPTHTEYTAGTNPDEIVTGDFNKDGHTDVAVTNNGSANMSVFINNGSGTFASAVNYTTGSSPVGITAADFNGDGYTDLAVANHSSNTISVFLNEAGTSPGNFYPKADYSIGSGPNGLVSVDVNKDGHPDLVAADNTGNAVSVILNNGNGTFGSDNEYAVASSSGPSEVTAADFNGDGWPDLATSNNTTGNVSMLMSSPSGSSYQGALTVNTSSASTAGIIVQGSASQTADLLRAQDSNGNSLLNLNASGNLALNGGATYTKTGVYNGFATKVDYSGASDGVATADFNGDGKPDIVAGNWGAGTISVFLNNGNGTFAPGVSYAASTNPWDVAVGDFNGDGHPDIAVTDTNAGVVSVFLNKGNGTFATAVNYATGTDPEGIVAGDFNGDGCTDLAVVNYGSNTISVLKNNCNNTGTFATQVTYATGSYPRDITAGDFNRDGHLDLAVTNISGNDVSVFINNGSGGFASQVTYNTGSGPEGITSADFNGDGYPDLAVANNGAVSVLKNNGNGTFAAAVNYTTGNGPGNLTITAADVNNDGYPDLIVPNNTDSTVSVLLNNNDGTFAAQTTYATGSAPDGVAAADFNGDGYLDLAIGNATSVTLSVLMNNPSMSTYNGLFSLTSPTASTAGIVLQGAANQTADYFRLQDSNGNAIVKVDSKGSVTLKNTTDSTTAFNVQTALGTSVLSVDTLHRQVVLGAASASTPTILVLGTKTTSGNPSTSCTNGSIYYNAAEGVFRGCANSAWTNLTAGAGGINNGTTTQTANFNIQSANPNYVGAVIQGAAAGQTADLLDINATSGSSLLKVAANGNTAINAGATYSSGGTYNGFAAHSDITAGNDARAITYGDFNGDGKQDIAVTNWTDGTVSVLLGHGDGTFATQATYTVASPAYIATGDFNGDGCPDLAVTDYSNSSVSILLNKCNGSGTFNSPVTYATPSGPYGITVGDFNGDGYPDLAIATYSSSEMTILMNNGGNGFKAAVNYAAGTNDTEIVTGDFNKDGHLDVAVTNTGSATISVFINNGDGTFKTQVTYATGSSPTGIAAGDFNGDGYTDLAVANEGSNTISVFLNKAGTSPGNFFSKTDYAVGSAPWGLVATDVNRDGYPDLAASDYTGGAVSVILNNGNGSFGSDHEYPVALTSGPYEITSADFNNDGWPDIAVDDGNSTKVSVLMNNPSSSTYNGTLSVATTSASTGGIIVQGSTSQTADLIHVQGSSGNSLFNVSSSGNIGIGGGATYTKTGTFNGFSSYVTYSAGTRPYDVATGDLNGDGKPDIVSTNYGDNTVSVFMNNGNGTFAPRVSYTTGSGPLFVAVADVNNDGHPDIAVANYSSNTISVFMNNGNGTFAAKVDYTTGTGPSSIAAADFNGDGYSDIAVTDEGASTVSVFLNNGNGTFAAKTDYATGASPSNNSMAVADMNNDGYPDLEVADRQSPYSVSVLLNNGNGTFAAKTDYATSADGPTSVATADFNGDGYQDMVVGMDLTTGTSTIDVLMNNPSTTTYNAGLSLTAASSSTSGLILQGASGQVADMLRIQDASANTLFKVSSSGSVTLKNDSDSTTAFQVQTATGATIFSVNTLNQQIVLGSSSSTPTLLVLGSKTTSGNPATCTNGAIYYNTADAAVRACVAGTWTNLSNNDIPLAYGTKTSNVATTGTTFAAGADVLTSALTFTADGTSAYEVTINAYNWSNNTNGQSTQLRVNLDGSDAGIIAQLNENGADQPLHASGYLSVLSAGQHTINVRINVSSGTGTVFGGAGGAGTPTPIVITIKRL